MNDLVAFLNARLDDVELADWHARDCQTHRQMPANSPLGLGGAPMSCTCRVPAFVLADVAAKRQIIEEHYNDHGLCNVCADEPHYDATWRPYPCKTLRLLALPSADHPDYRKEWTP